MCTALDAVLASEIIPQLIIAVGVTTAIKAKKNNSKIKTNLCGHMIITHKNKIFKNSPYRNEPQPQLLSCW